MTEGISERRVRPESDGAPVPLSRYVQVIQRRRYRILGFIVAVVGITVCISALIAPRYESVAEMEFGTFDAPATEPVFATQTSLLQSPLFLSRILKQVRPSGFGPQEIAQGIRVVHPQFTNLLTVRFRALQATVAADVTNVLVRAYYVHFLLTAYRQRLDRLKGELNGKVWLLKADLARAENDSRMTSARRPGPGAHEDGVAHDEALRQESKLRRSIQDAADTIQHLEENSAALEKAAAASSGIDQNRYSEVTEQIRQASIGIGFANDYVRIVQLAQPANAPVWPNTVKNAIIAFVLATLIALGVAAVEAADAG